jgi:LysR family transcriptional activator of nhaA
MNVSTRLNFHHLHYFWFVVRQGRLTEAARLLRVSQSALSTQIRQLEETLGQRLFDRVGRRLVLTEAGRIAFSYAEEIFRKGEELSALLAQGIGPERQVIRIGAVATQSRNFQEAFLKPVLDRRDAYLTLRSGRLEELLTQLASHQIDLVLSNVPVQADDEHPWRCRRIARQQVSVIGQPRAGGEPFRLPDDLRGARLLVPGVRSEIRPAFDLLCEQWHLRPTIAAEVDDMAMLRLLARDTDALAVMPPVVVRDEIAAGRLVEHARLPGLYENFYAITIRRHFEHSHIRQLLERTEADPLFLTPEDGPSE